MTFNIKNMKTKILILTGLFMSLSFYSCAGEFPKKKETPLCAEWLQPDSSAYAHLGKRLATILFSPSKVRCYHLTGKETVGKDEIQIEPHFVRDTLISVLTPQEQTILQYALLSSEKNYERDSMVIMSPYVPCLEFEFTKKKESAHIVISLSDFSWSIIYDDKKQFNYNYFETSLIEKFCQYYLSKLNIKK